MASTAVPTAVPTSVPTGVMQVAVVTGVGEVELRSEPLPVIGAQDILVRVGACGLCTMERRLFSGEKQIYPVAPGHEVAGRVVETGEQVAPLPGAPKVGDLVAVDLLTRCGTCTTCRRGRSAVCKQPQGSALADGTISMGAGLADFVRVSASQAYVTGDIPIAQAAMGEPLACVVHSVRLSGMLAGDRVAVLGAGYMGRLHHALCRAWGAGSVGLVDVSSSRLDEAADGGADWTATPQTTRDVGGKADIVFVTAAAAGLFELAVDICDSGGTIVLYSAFPKELTGSFGLDHFHHEEITVVGVYSQEPQDWRIAAGLLRSGALSDDLDRLVTARYSLETVADALQQATHTPVYRVLVGAETGA